MGVKRLIYNKIILYQVYRCVFFYIGDLLILSGKARSNPLDKHAFFQYKIEMGRLIQGPSRLKCI